eukprot:CAMPEP_0174968928 /NCGR_PEP_ID=MMETSP0004_2-20121128/8437_1 /TAXON_ID=420556 /ORGANISM="Ochromonas sp., Strain CCMP1393" /LENGTH=67 /DNA_ID=CAMNT_0016218277 /DNA_START=600 /DNA_END=803 /DNA_ORIENTATION=+
MGDRRPVKDVVVTVRGDTKASCCETPVCLYGVPSALEEDVAAEQEEKEEEEEDVEAERELLPDTVLA